MGLLKTITLKDAKLVILRLCPVLEIPIGRALPFVNDAGAQEKDTTKANCAGTAIGGNTVKDYLDVLGVEIVYLATKL